MDNTLINSGPLQSKAYAVNAHRAAFLWHVKEIAPEVVNDLTDTVLPKAISTFGNTAKEVCENLYTLGANIFHAIPQFGRDTYERIVRPSTEPDVRKFVKVFEIVLGKYELTKFAWLREHYFEWLCIQLPGFNKSFRLEMPQELEPLLKPFQMDVKIDGTWDPTFEHYSRFKDRALRQLDEALEKYRDQTLIQLKSEGFVASKRPKDLERVKWLVRWTVQSKTEKSIKTEFSISDSEKLSNIFKSWENDFQLPYRRKKRINGGELR